MLRAVQHNGGIVLRASAGVLDHAVEFARGGRGYPWFGRAPTGGREHATLVTSRQASALP